MYKSDFEWSRLVLSSRYRIFSVFPFLKCTIWLHRCLIKPLPLLTYDWPFRCWDTEPSRTVCFRQTWWYTFVSLFLWYAVVFLLISRNPKLIWPHSPPYWPHHLDWPIIDLSSFDSSATVCFRHTHGAATPCVVFFDSSYRQLVN